uniref:Uncharacterized protein n=1 Tax=Nelumbo nucifera TaxID=4432 RepID=A0A822XSZ1_NELNU|nr:TPA_asm: hypothetical protein HUJ06_023489 [Nelumbo nucifera]
MQVVLICRCDDRTGENARGRRNRERGGREERERE